MRRREERSSGPGCSTGGTHRTVVRRAEEMLVDFYCHLVVNADSAEMEAEGAV